MNQKNEKLKVGLIVDHEHVNLYQRELIERSKRSELYEITHLIVQKTGRDEDTPLLTKIRGYIKRRGVQKLIHQASFQTLLKLEKTILSRLGLMEEPPQRDDLSDLELELLVVEPQVSKSGLVYRYTDEDLARIRDLSLSLLIRGGGGILRGDVLHVCPYGVISFHHANNEVNRGTPPGFWEIFYKQAESGFIIQLLKDELDGGDVIYKGGVFTQFIYTLNVEHLLKKSNLFMHQAIERLLSEETTEVYPKRPYAYPLFTTPTVAQQLGYLGGVAAHLAKKGARRLQGKRLRWGVAYQFCADWRDVTLRKSKRVPNPAHRFLADPFVLYHQDKHYCFVEDYDARVGKGCISVLEINASGAHFLGQVLDEPFHLSFPYVFEHEGELYMCPESHEKREIRLYKCASFPFSWELQEVLISDVDAADTILFFKEERWWLITNICSAQVSDHSAELHVFSSTSLLNGEWTPHPKNPVVFSPRRGRNGGFIRDQERLYRVFQRQGWCMYGEAFGVAEITSLTPSDYQEEALFTVEPQFFPGIEGTHTYNYQAGLMVMDVVEVDRF